MGAITIALLIPRYTGRTLSSNYSYDNGSRINVSNLGATAYNADYSGAQTNSFLNFGSRQPYQAVITKSYNPSSYSGSPSTYGSSSDSDYYYTTETPSYTTTNYNDVQGYVPPGCENGTDYSTTTNEPCG